MGWMTWQECYRMQLNECSQFQDSDSDVCIMHLFELNREGHFMEITIFFAWSLFRFGVLN